MKKHGSRTETRSFVYLESATCDRCEKQIELRTQIGWSPSPLSVTFSLQSENFSRHDFFMGTSFDICDDCCEEFLNSFKHPPQRDWEDY